ncbi:MAG: hypothetical protein NTZ53_00170 [Cyanobacteria bacterium]|nr:hypothetical protein [Cyanobacteriota bacterium]
MGVLARIRPRFVGHAVLPSNWREVVRLAARLASELELPWAELAQQHSRRLGGGRRWVGVGRTGERLDLATTP